MTNFISSQNKLNFVALYNSTRDDVRVDFVNENAFVLEGVVSS